MINGVHTIIYSDDAPTTRAFLKDVLGWSSIDSGDGWLIFEAPPTEMGVHPTRGGGGEEWAISARSVFGPSSRRRPSSRATRAVTPWN